MVLWGWRLQVNSFPSGGCQPQQEPALPGDVCWANSLQWVPDCVVLTPALRAGVSLGGLGRRALHSYGGVKSFVADGKGAGSPALCWDRREPACIAPARGPPVQHPLLRLEAHSNLCPMGRGRAQNHKASPWPCLPPGGRESSCSAGLAVSVHGRGGPAALREFTSRGQGSPSAPAKLAEGSHGAGGKSRLRRGLS